MSNFKEVNSLFKKKSNEIFELCNISNLYDFKTRSKNIEKISVRLVEDLIKKIPKLDASEKKFFKFFHEMFKRVTPENAAGIKRGFFNSPVVTRIKNYPFKRQYVKQIFIDLSRLLELFLEYNIVFHEQELYKSKEFKNFQKLKKESEQKFQIKPIFKKTIGLRENEKIFSKQTLGKAGKTAQNTFKDTVGLLKSDKIFSMKGFKRTAGFGLGGLLHIAGLLTDAPILNLAASSYMGRRKSKIEKEKKIVTDYQQKLTKWKKDKAFGLKFGKKSSENLFDDTKEDISLAGGGTFVTKKPTKMLVGDNPGGKEMVSVMPLSGKGKTRIRKSSNLENLDGGGRSLISSNSDTSKIVTALQKNTEILSELYDTQKRFNDFQIATESDRFLKQEKRPVIGEKKLEATRLDKMSSSISSAFKNVLPVLGGAVVGGLAGSSFGKWVTDKMGVEEGSKTDKAVEIGSTALGAGGAALAMRYLTKKVPGISSMLGATGAMGTPVFVTNAGEMGGGSLDLISKNLKDVLPSAKKTSKLLGVLKNVGKIGLGGALGYGAFKGSQALLGTGKEEGEKIVGYNENNEPIYKKDTASFKTKDMLSKGVGVATGTGVTALSYANQLKNIPKTEKIGSLLSSGIESVKSSKVGSFVGNAIGKGKNLLPSLGKTSEVGSSIASKLSGVTKILGPTARILGKVALPLQAAMSVGDAYSGFSNASEISGKKDVDMGDKVGAAASSVISGLSFGLLDEKSIFGAGASLVEKVKEIQQIKSPMDNLNKDVVKKAFTGLMELSPAGALYKGWSWFTDNEKKKEDEPETNVVTSFKQFWADPSWKNFKNVAQTTYQKTKDTALDLGKNFKSSLSNLISKYESRGDTSSVQTEDSGIVSYGKHQATVKSGSLGEILEQYSKTGGLQAEKSKYYENIIKNGNAQQKESLRTDKEFHEFLKEAGKEDVMKQAQEDVWTKKYLAGGVDVAKRNNIDPEKNKKALAMITDTNVQGGADTITKQMVEKYGVPGEKLTEDEWVREYAKIRNERLESLAESKYNKGQTKDAQMLMNSRNRVSNISEDIIAGKVDTQAEKPLVGTVTTETQPITTVSSLDKKLQETSNEKTQRSGETKNENLPIPKTPLQKITTEEPKNAMQAKVQEETKYSQISMLKEQAKESEARTQNINSVAQIPSTNNSSQTNVNNNNVQNVSITTGDTNSFLGILQRKTI